MTCCPGFAFETFKKFLTCSFQLTQARAETMAFTLINEDLRMFAVPTAECLGTKKVRRNMIQTVTVQTVTKAVGRTGVMRLSEWKEGVLGFADGLRSWDIMEIPVSLEGLILLGRLACHSWLMSLTSRWETF